MLRPYLCTCGVSLVAGRCLLCDREKPIKFDRSTDYNDAERQREIDREGRENDLAEMRRHR